MLVLVIATITLYSTALAANIVPKGWEATTSFVGNPFVGGPWQYPACAKDFPDESSLWVFAVNKPLDANVTLSVSAFSTPDLYNWAAHDNILDMSGFKWANASIYAPTPIFRDGKYYLFFSATGYPPDSKKDERTTGNYSGIGVGVSDKPGGPYKNPLPNNTALILADDATITEPYGPAILADDDQVYLYYGSGGSLHSRELNEKMTSFDNESKILVTPPGHFGGVRVFKRGNLYYLIWNNTPLVQGSAGKPTGSIHYAVSTKPQGPFSEGGILLTGDPAVAHTVNYADVINPIKDIWFLFYSRVQTIPDYPKNTVDGLAWEAMFFEDDGSIAPVPMQTFNTFLSEYKWNKNKIPIGWLPNASLSVQPDPDNKQSSHLELDGTGVPEVVHATMFTNFSDFELDILISMDALMDTGSAGVIFRARTDDNFEKWAGYVAEYFANGTLALSKILPDTGKQTGLGTNEPGKNDLNVKDWPRLRIRAQGDLINVYRGDAPIDKPAISTHDKQWASGWTGVRAHLAKGMFATLEIKKIKSIVHAGFALTDADRGDLR